MATETVAPADLLLDLSWQLEGRCREIDPELFFPERGGVPESRWAKHVCGRCEVQALCLEYALAREEKFGVWGGKTARERRHLKRRRASAAA
jgi:WhiB family redox-sensing transcriptional regulator